MRITIPKVFYDDHLCRELPGGEIVKETKRNYTIEVTDAEREELLSDAAFYADPDMGYGSELPGLVASARATVRAIESQR